jgi:hypothetical protein
MIINQGKPADAVSTPTGPHVFVVCSLIHFLAYHEIMIIHISNHHQYAISWIAALPKTLLYCCKSGDTTLAAAI